MMGKPPRVEAARAATTGDLVHLRTASDGSPICPVCGCVWPHGAGHAWGGTGEMAAHGLTIVGPSWDTCPCCKTEFGNDDVPDEGETLEQSWAVLRTRWLERVGRAPDVLAQLRHNLELNP